MKKTLSILLALCLLLGCASAFADNPTVSQLAINSYYSTVDLKDAYLLKKIADNAGVTVDWNLLDPGTYAESVSPMLASGQDLADVVMLPDLDTNQTYLSAGLFEPLDTHFDIMPNYKKFLDENPIIKGSLTAVDGHIYYVPDRGDQQLSARADVQRPLAGEGRHRSAHHAGRLRGNAAVLQG